MTDQDSGQVVSQEQNGQTAPGDQQGDQPSSPQQPVFSKEQQAWIEDLVKRTDQSAKDRAVNRIQETVAQQQDQLDKFAALLKQGMSPDQAKREMAIDDLLNQRQAPPASAQPASSNAGRQTAPETVDFTAIYQAAGVDANDNDVIRLTMQNVNNPTQLKASLIDLRMRRNQQPAGNAATVATPSSAGTTSADQQLKSLTAEAQRLSLDPIRNMTRLQEIDKEMARLTTK